MPNTPQSIPGTNLASAIVPFTTADQFPTHYAQYGKGGWRSVDTLADRDAIPAPRLENGMVVFVNEIQTPFVYINSTWEQLVTGSGGGKQTFVRQYYTHTVDALPPESSVEFELPFGKTVMVLKLSLSRPAKITVWSTPDHTETNPYSFLATDGHLTDDGSMLLSDNSVLKLRNYSMFTNMESPVQEKVYAVLESTDAGDGPVTLNVTYIVIESDVQSGNDTFNTILNGIVDPDSQLGHNGDFYINTNSWNIFGPRASDAWTPGTSLIGPPGTGGSSKYVVPMNFTFSPTVSEILLFHTFVETVTFAQNFVGSAGSVESVPTSQYVIELQKNGVAVGSVTIDATGTFTFQSSSELTFNSGDTLKFVAPSAPDATIANASLSLLGTRAA